MKRQGNRLALLIFLLSLILNFVFTIPVLSDPKRAYQADSEEYESLALSLLNSNDYPSINRTPGYPFFIATIYAIFGVKPAAVIIFQAILNSLSTMLVYLVGKLIFDPKVALAGAFIYAVNPLQLLYSSQLMTEMLFTFILLIAMYFFLIFIKNEKTINMIVAAFFFALSTMCRPIGLFLPVIIAFIIPILLKKTLKLKILYSGVFLFLYLLFLMPWAIRNYVRYEVFTVSTISQYNLVYYNAAGVIAEVDHISFSEANTKLEEMIFKEGKKIHAEFERRDSKYIFEDPLLLRNPELRKMALNIGLNSIRNNFSAYLKTHLIGVIKTLAFPPLGIYQIKRHFHNSEFTDLVGMDEDEQAELLSESNNKDIYNLLKTRLLKLPSVLRFLWIYASLFMVMQYIAVFYSLKSLFGKTQMKYVIILLILILYFVLIPGIAGNSRFRVPVEPYLAVIAGIGLAVILNNLKEVKMLFKRKTTLNE
ncbi:ArnT family glycosyltransferase [Acidobacteriota bacterium]